jgi:hypothetical protein
VQELKKLGLDDDHDLVVTEIPVVYDTVDDVVPKLWQTHKPHVSIGQGSISVTLKY